MRLLRRLIVLATLVAIVVPLTCVVYEWVNGAKRAGQIELKGLQATVQVDFDQWGIPHIEAATDQDAFFALGYLQAQDRLNQMEGLRRIAQGRLAEIFGPELLSVDRFFRTLGLQRYAERYVANLADKAPHRRMAEAYLAGVNEYLETRRLSLVTYAAFGQPEPFTLVDMASIAAYMAFTFDRGLRVDSWYYELSRELDQAYLDDLPVTSQPTQIGSHDGDTVQAAWFRALAEVNQYMDHFGRFNGSNAWVLAGSRTTSGKPILANDTHIKFSNPSVWYEAYLESRDLAIYGHFIPGLSFPILGHGPEHGWGITIFHNNDVDLMFENLKRTPSGDVLAGAPELGLREHRESIAVRGADDIEMTVYETMNGPVFTELLSSGRPVTVRWNYYHQTQDNLQGFYELLSASHLATAKSAVAKIAAPSLNILYANRQGDIAWWARGKIRQFANPVAAFLPQDATKSQPKVVPTDGNPFLINPPSGVIASTNEQPGPAIQGYYSYPQRKRRLESLLAQREHWSVADLKAVQTDIKVNFHEQLVNRLALFLRASPEHLNDELSQKALQKLVEWEGEHRLSLAAPTLFYEFAYQVLRAGIEDEMGEERFHQFLSSEVPLKMLLHLNRQPLSPWWDVKSTKPEESQQLIYQQAWSAALNALQQRYGTDPATWLWAEHHQVTYKHPLGRLPVIGDWFNLGPYPVVGGMETLNQIAFSFGPGPRSPSFGPATRRLIDFSDPMTSQGIIPTGQSERLLDPHYDDQVKLYLNSQYRAQRFQVQPETTPYQQLVLQPASPQPMVVTRKTSVSGADEQD
jgi:penicillin amidase